MATLTLSIVWMGRRANRPADGPARWSGRGRRRRHRLQGRFPDIMFFYSVPNMLPLLFRKLVVVIVAGQAHVGRVEYQQRRANALLVIWQRINARGAY